MLGRLLLRTLPTEYTENSTYTWFPLMTPPAINEILTRLGVKDRYDLNRSSSKEAGPVEVKEYGEVAGIIADTTKFSDPFLDRVHSVIHGSGSALLLYHHYPLAEWGIDSFLLQMISSVANVSNEISYTLLRVAQKKWTPSPNSSMRRPERSLTVIPTLWLVESVSVLTS
jgi:hypothetical protein